MSKRGKVEQKNWAACTILYSTYHAEARTVHVAKFTVLHELASYLTGHHCPFCTPAPFVAVSHPGKTRCKDRGILLFPWSPQLVRLVVISGQTSHSETSLLRLSLGNGSGQVP
jgi:hypothetical protein